MTPLPVRPVAAPRSPAGPERVEGYLPALVLFSTVALALAACSSLLTSGSVVNEHIHGHSDQPQIAPADGEYSLYSMYGDGTPLHTIPVRAGDALGFRTAQTGQIDVVAGDDEWTMSDGDYIWKRN